MWDGTRKAEWAAEYDAFYRSARSDLLLQTYAYCGDLQDTEKAVRHAFVVGWHHWSTLRRQEDRLAWLRPVAFTRARRRHTARPWPRRHDTGERHRATVAALRSLSPQQRKMLVLTQLAEQPLALAAPEVGATVQQADRMLQTAVSAFSTAMSLPASGIREPLRALGAETETRQLPRTTILTRAGNARRRTATLIGAAAAVASLLGAGLLVTDSDGVRPMLAKTGLVGGAPAAGDTSVAAASTPEPAEEDADEAPPEDPLPEYSLLYRNQVAEVGPPDWRVVGTSRNTDGDGLAFPCQGARYADPDGVATYIRTFRAGKGGRRADAGQAVEVSQSSKAAKQAYESAAGWYGGCSAARMRLLSTRSAPGIGNQALLVTLRQWGDRPRTMIYGMARTGAVTTTTQLAVPGNGAPDMDAAARMLGRAVDSLCRTPHGGACTDGSNHRGAEPVRLQPGPALLHELDLPPVSGVGQPWVGTEPGPLKGDNLAATRCDDTTFGATSRTRTRTFVIPTARRLPPEFGLTETVGALPAEQARALVQRVRSELGSCPDDDLGTEVTRLAERNGDGRQLTAWRVTSEISDSETVDFLMAVVRNGTAVAQIGFVPADDARLGDDPFVDIAERAQERLTALPGPAQD